MDEQRSVRPRPPLSFVGAKFGISDGQTFPSSIMQNRFLEMRVFATAASEAQRAAIEQEIRNKYLL